MSVVVVVANLNCNFILFSIHKVPMCHVTKVMYCFLDVEKTMRKSNI